MTNVFSDVSSDTPWANPGWTVQSAEAGGQNLVKNAAPSNFAVTSVNSKPGPTVTLAASDVGALPSNTTYVASVNGNHGALTLNAASVGALPSTAVAAKQSASGQVSYTGTDGTGSNAAKLSDLQALASLVDSLNSALQAAGLEAAS